MSRFRETLWFKKGHEALPETPPTGDVERPIEDRYDDDDSISPIDHAQFSVVTGTTQPVRIFKKGNAAPEADETMHIVVAQMKRGRAKVYAMIGASMACAVVVVAAFVV